MTRIRATLPGQSMAAILIAFGLGMLASVVRGERAPAPRCLNIRFEVGEDQQAVALLRRMLLLGRKGCLILSGRLSLTAPLRITAANSGLRIYSSQKEPSILVATRGAIRGIEIVGASDVVVEGIKLTGFARDGIFASNSRNLTIKSVTVSETGATGWSQGGIHLTGTSTGAVVEANTVDGSDYAGIIVDTDNNSDVSHVIIRSNRVQRSCQRIFDCGAIYVNDRGRRSSKILIADNVIADFGPASVEGRGIYLDDWASHVTVRGNRIAGPGHFAFQIHGGHDNRIAGNHIDMNGIISPLLYQAAIDGTRALMTGNILIDNVFDHQTSRNAAFAFREQSGAGAVRFKGNQQCIVGRCASIP
ncbi:right-handed parallel beta-helix repeat-containing protein [Sphingobium yanoikuyae]|uniref:Right-handed parallel beta-helix repeat-containing protein n=1 Tax=Sphingobium yanoikuyae TaxID=13690 RepID=A0A3G2UPS4_SPHYA|nr:right-handed parallel beta-helix repeat-containing protein [Sphingobium yanoikuyae]AYO77227.1 right-handed parallel beta-helix repeat-containing protein [Sphingobium yanoikuyae]